MFEAMIRRVGEDAATRAFNRALNREGDKLRTAVRRSLRKETGVKAALVDRALKTYRSSFSNLVYSIEASGGHFGLSHFNPVQFKYGTRAKPWNRWTRFEGAFVSAKLHNNVFVREGKARLPIRKLWGPAIPVEMVRGATEKVFREAEPRVIDEAMRQLKLVLKV